MLSAVNAMPPSLSFEEQVQAAEDVLTLVGFPATLHNSPAGNLPTFQRKKIMIASALALKPKVLLMDEPASSLTGPEIDNNRVIIAGIRTSGIAIILVEHILQLLLDLSDRLIVLGQGSIIVQGLPTDVIKDPLLVETYLGNAHV